MKTTHQAFDDLIESISNVRSEIVKSLPDLGHRTVYALYTIATLIFYGLSIYLITEGHYFDAIIYSIIGLYFNWRK